MDQPKKRIDGALDREGGNEGRMNWPKSARVTDMFSRELGAQVLPKAQFVRAASRFFGNQFSSHWVQSPLMANNGL